MKLKKPMKQDTTRISTRPGTTASHIGYLAFS